MERIKNELGVSDLIAKILFDYNIDTKEKYDKYINPNLDDIVNIDLFTGIKEATKRIELAIENNERILIYGDYDCDGICATAILYKFLLTKNVEVAYYIPDRIQDGYGLSQEVLERIVEDSTFNPDLIITVDCGISSHEIIKYSQEVLGLDFIVTDHHELPEILPNCICINFKLDRDKNIFVDYSGAGTVLRLIEALSSKEEIKKYLELVAIANIGDVVPLIEDNRIITKLGMEKIKNTEIVGLKEIFKILNINVDKIKASDIAFQVVPKINAIGRLDNSNEVVDLFISNDIVFCQRLVEKLVAFNFERKNLSEDLTKACEEIVVQKGYNNQKFIVLDSKYWLPGILGITCSRLVSIFKKPIIMLSYDSEQNIYSGSGRSINGVDIREALNSQKDKLISFGGHKMACGLKVDSEIQIAVLREGLNEYMREKYDDQIYFQNLDKYYEINENPKLDDFKLLEKFEPFGLGNEKPEFILKTDFQDFRYTKNMKSLLARLNNNFKIFSFSQANEKDAFQSNLIKEIKGDIEIDIFNEVETLKMNSYKANIDYNTNIKKVDKDILIYHYLEEILEDENDLKFKIKKINSFEQTLDILKNGEFGTIIIAYLEDTMKDYINYIQDKQEKKFIKRVSLLKKDGGSPLTTLILSPSSNVDLSLYNNIIFLDSPLTNKRIRKFNINNRANVYTVDNLKSITKIKNYIKNNTPSREECLKVYSFLREIIKTNYIFNYENIYNNELKISKLKYLFSIKILLTMGILNFDITQGYKIQKKQKQDINENIFLNLLKELGE